MFRQIKDWFATAGLEPQRLDLCSSVAVIGHLVSSGAALGVLPAKMMEADVLAGRVNVLRPVPEHQSRAGLCQLCRGRPDGAGQRHAQIDPEGARPRWIICASTNPREI